MEDIFKSFRAFLGLPRYDSYNYNKEDDRNKKNFPDSRYDAFSDPSEMQHYFEEQMSKILRNFDIFEFGRDEPFFGDFNNPGEIDFFGQDNQIPSIDEGQSGELRDQFLKPGYERPTGKHFIDKTDKELDQSNINIGDLDSVLTGKFFKNTEQPRVTTKFFGKSISTKTVMKPDGSIEIHKTIRDNEGNEETTITKKIGDKEHSVTKKRDKDGKEEIIENFINIDESDSNTLLSIPNISEHKPWSLFDHFFK